MKNDISELENRKLYILISQTHTVPARIIKFWTKEPYAHASIALDLELREMYSFARKGIYNPFNCGFIIEDIDTGIFGRDVETSCVVLELTVTDKQYRHVLQELAALKQMLIAIGIIFGDFMVLYEIRRLRGNIIISVPSSWHVC